MIGKGSDMRKPAKKQKPTGSTTNASDAVNDTTLPSKPTTDEVVDHGGEESFPASDPMAVGHAADKAAEREPEPKERDLETKQRRSPDWLLHPPRR
jgi:hypothetical protein